VTNGEFPPPKVICAGRGRAVCWSRNAVLAWITALPEADGSARPSFRWGRKFPTAKHNGRTVAPPEACAAAG
jgi:hypothetical protein